MSLGTGKTPFDRVAGGQLVDASTGGDGGNSGALPTPSGPHGNSGSAAQPEPGRGQGIGGGSCLASIRPGASGRYCLGWAAPLDTFARLSVGHALKTSPPVKETKGIYNQSVCGDFIRTESNKKTPAKYVKVVVPERGSGVDIKRGLNVYNYASKLGRARMPCPQAHPGPPALAACATGGPG